MPAERFYANVDLYTETIALEGAELHHLAHVMRTRVGDLVALVNGKGQLAQAKVSAISKNSARLAILSVTSIPVPIPHIILAVPFMRLSKLELVVEKCVELGAGAFWLYPAQYADKHNLSPHQLERLLHIAISAMKQSGRLDLPEIKIFNRFADLFQSDHIYCFGDTRPNAERIKQQKQMVFITGPEKGFSEKELKLLDEKATGVKLHDNILRAETAPIAAMSLSLTPDEHYPFNILQK